MGSTELDTMLRYQTSPGNTASTCAQLLAFKKGQRKHPEMRYVARELTELELDELVVYYSTLPPR
jgi:cytochrome c553